MTFEVVDNSDAKRVELAFHGVITLDQLQRSLRVVSFYLKAHEWNGVLIDLRQSISVMSFEEIKKFLSVEAPSVDESWKIALLISTHQEEQMKHAEELAKRLGVQLVVFGCEFIASSWLSAPEMNGDNESRDTVAGDAVKIYQRGVSLH